MQFQYFSLSDLTVRMKTGDIRYVPVSGNGEIFIPEEALINEGTKTFTV